MKENRQGFPSRWINQLRLRSWTARQSRAVVCKSGLLSFYFNGARNHGLFSFFVFYDIVI